MYKDPSLSPRPLVGRRADTPLSATRKGSWHNAYDYTSVVGTSCLDRCLWSGHPSDAAYLLFDGFHLRSVDIGSVGKTVTGVAPRQGCVFHSPHVEARSAEDRGKEDPDKDIRPRQGVALTSLAMSATPWRGRGIACVARSTGLRGYTPRPRGYGASTHKGCFVPHSSQ